MIYYYSHFIKYWQSYMYIIDPVGSASELKEDQVLKVVWTEDSQYVLGFGENTFRL